MSKSTRTALLIEERLGRPLERHVMRLRGTGARASMSWEQIARDLSERTGVHVTSETVRLWFYDADQRRIAKARRRDAA